MASSTPSPLPVKSSNKERVKLTNTSSLLLNVKKRLAWNLCADLLYPPISAIGALKFEDGDSDIIKEFKTKEYEKKKAEVERQKIEREPELLNKLDEIVERVVYSRSEKPADNEEAWAPGGGAVGGEKTSALAGLACDLCGNKTHFIEDLSSGDTICLGKDGQWSCGKVVQDHRVFEGVEKRNFEDDDKDRHQHGPEADPLMPDSENMRTYIAASSTDAASKALSKELNRIHQRVEDNLSTIGNDERRTRTATRSKQKKAAFDIMARVCSSLGIHHVVLNKANIEFARYRDVREHVHNFHAVVAACMLLAYETILSEGGHVDAAFEVDNQTKRFFGEDKFAFGGLSNIPESLLSAEDVAVSSVRSISMGKWDCNNLRLWLTEVLDARDTEDMDAEVRRGLHVTLVDKVVDWVNAERNKLALESQKHQDSKKRKYPEATPSFFGSTTMSHRNKKFYVGDSGGRAVGKQRMTVKPNVAKAPVCSNASRDRNDNTKIETSMTCGQIFMRMNLETTLGSDRPDGITEEQMNAAISIIRSAIKTRTVYDAALKEKAVIEEKEARRHRAENSSRFLVLNKSAAGELIKQKAPNPPASPKTSTTMTSSGATSVDEGEDDDMLMEMLSADQSGVETTSAMETVDVVESEDSTGADEDGYNVYDALREEERSRNSMMRFKVRR